MSYDLHIGQNDFNYTWNLGEFFRKYINSGEKSGLEALSGMTGKDASLILKSAILLIKRDSYKRDNGIPTWQYFSEKYDPENYWRDVMSATLFMMELYFAAESNPRKKWIYST